MSVPKVKKILFTEYIKKAEENKLQPFKSKRESAHEEKLLHEDIFNVINNYESSKFNPETCHLMSSDKIDLI